MNLSLRVARGWEGTVWDWPIVVVQLLSHVWLFVTPGTQHTRLLCFPLSPGICSDSCMLSQWCYLTISSSAAPFPFLPSFSPRIRVFSNELALHQVAKVLELQLQKQSFQWIFRLISFRSDRFDLPPVQGTLRSLLQDNNLKGSILLHSSLWSNFHIHTWLEKPWYIHTTIFKTDNQQGSTVLHRELCSTLCNDLNGKRIWKNRYIYMYNWTALLDTWNTVNQLHSNIK